MFRSFKPRSFIAFMAVAALSALIAAGCGLLGDDDNDNNAVNGNGGSTSVRVLEAVMSNEINEEQQATGLVSRVFPQATTQVFAVLTLEGVSPGTEITGRWFQLSVQDAPPNGAEVSAAGVQLTEDNIFENRGRVALNLAGGGSNLPEGDWLLRVYADGVFIRTMAFVITRQAVALPNNNGGQPAPPPGGDPAPPPGDPPPPTAQPEPYVVQEGDSLNAIAERFRAENESVEEFLSRLIDLNQLQPGSSLFVGQELLIPPAP